MAASGKKSALFVCLGNICRSPIAEAVFAHLVRERGLTDQWVIDSAATGSWHTGSLPDIRAIECMEKHSIVMSHRARQLAVEDFYTFQYIFGMDKENIKIFSRDQLLVMTAHNEFKNNIDAQGPKVQKSELTEDRWCTFRISLWQLCETLELAASKNIKRMAPKSHSAAIELLGQYDTNEIKDIIIRDPYFDATDKGFEEVYEQCLRCCEGFLDFSIASN